MQDLKEEREALLELEEHCRDLLEQLYSFSDVEVCAYTAQVELGVVRQREHALKRLRDVEQEMGHVYTEA
jgi:hypothetical protein